MSSSPRDLLFVTDPVNSILSVHGECRNRDASFGDGVLSDGAEGFLWCLGGGRSGESGHPVADCLLVGGRHPWASPWPSGVEAVLPSGRHTHFEQRWNMGGGEALLYGFWLKAEDRLASPSYGLGIRLQSEDESVFVWHTFSIPSLCRAMSFSPNPFCLGEMV